MDLLINPQKQGDHTGETEVQGVDKGTLEERPKSVGLVSQGNALIEGC